MFPFARFKVEDESMYPALKSGDYLLINKLSKNFSVGDIVVFRRGEKYFVKRIAKILDEKFFVIGDNFSASEDSRKFGLIRKKDVVGKLLLKFISKKK